MRPISHICAITALLVSGFISFSLSVSPAQAQSCPSGFGWAGGYLCVAYNVSQSWCSSNGGRFINPGIAGAPTRCEAAASTPQSSGSGSSGYSGGGSGGYSSGNSGYSGGGGYTGGGNNALQMFGLGLGALGVLNDLFGGSGGGERGGNDYSHFNEMRRIGNIANHQGNALADQAETVEFSDPSYALSLWEQAQSRFREALGYYQSSSDYENIELINRNLDIADRAIANLRWDVDERRRMAEREREAERQRQAELLARSAREAEERARSQQADARRVPGPQRPPAAAPSESAARPATGPNAALAAPASLTRDDNLGQALGNHCPAQPKTRQDIAICYRNIARQFQAHANTCQASAINLQSLGPGPAPISSDPAGGQRGAFESCRQEYQRGAQYADCVATGILQPGTQYNPLVKTCAQRFGYVN